VHQSFRVDQMTEIDIALADKATKSSLAAGRGWGQGFSGAGGPFKCNLIGRVPLERTGAVAATVAIGSALPDVPLPHDVDLDLEDECVRVACLGVL
jgi:hypothetical protein